MGPTKRLTIARTSAHRPRPRTWNRTASRSQTPTGVGRSRRRTRTRRRVARPNGRWSRAARVGGRSRSARGRTGPRARIACSPICVRTSSRPRHPRSRSRKAATVGIACVCSVGACTARARSATGSRRRITAYAEASRRPARSMADRCTIASTTGRSTTRKTTPVSRGSRTRASCAAPTGWCGTTGVRRPKDGGSSDSSARTKRPSNKTIRMRTMPRPSPPPSRRSPPR